MIVNESDANRGKSTYNDGMSLHTQTIQLRGKMGNGGNTKCATKIYNSVATRYCKIQEDFDSHILDHSHQKCKGVSNIQDMFQTWVYGSWNQHDREESLAVTKFQWKSKGRWKDQVA